MAAFPMALTLAAILCAGGSALAAEGSHCLNKEQRRAVLASGKVVPLAQAIRAVKPPRGEVVRARLCERGTGFVYLLTLLSRDGKVTLATVDAVSGRLAGR